MVMLHTEEGDTKLLKEEQCPKTARPQTCKITAVSTSLKLICLMEGSVRFKSRTSLLTPNGNIHNKGNEWSELG